MSGRKNKFSKAMTHLKSSKIDEKIGYLNKEMKKMRVISEQPANSTSDLYSTIEYIPAVPESPAEYTDVPDPNGVRDSEWTQPSNGFDVNDPATWENAYNDFSWMYNSDDVAGETDRPVLDHIDVDWTGGEAGSGIMLSHTGWGQSLGYLGNDGVYQPLITAGSTSYNMIPPIQRGSHFDGAHYQYSIPDDKWAQMQSIYAKYEAMVAAGNVATQTIKVWYGWSYFFNGSWENVGYPKKDTGSGKFILINATLFKKAGDYMSKPHENEIPGYTVVLTQHGLDDPNYYPGNPNGFMDFLRNSLDVGREAFDWLLDLLDDDEVAGGLPYTKDDDPFGADDSGDDWEDDSDIPGDFPFDFASLGAKDGDMIAMAMDPKQQRAQAKEISQKSDGEVQSALEKLKDALDGSIDAVKNWKGLDGKGFTMAQKAEWVADTASKIGTAGKVYVSYLSGGLKDGSIDNEFLGADYVNDAFKDADINQDGNIVVGDNVIGSGGKPSYDAKTGEVIIPFNYDFDTNQEQIIKDPDKYDVNASVLTAAGMVSAWILGGKYGLDSVPVPGAGYATWLAKSVGSAQGTTGHEIRMTVDKLKKVNPYLLGQLKNKGIITEGLSLLEGWESPKHTYIDKDQQKRWFKEKDVAPVYPKKAPPKMMNGYHPSLLPKLGTEDTPIPQIKIRKKDLLRNHNLKKDEVKKLINLVDSLNDYIKRNPEHLAYARERYPKHDPRLATLNYKMDMQLAAADEYVEKHFPENKRLLNKVLKATKQSIKLTDPKTFKSKDGTFTTFNKLERARHFDNEYKPKERKVIKKRRGKSVSRFFYKPKKKTKYDILKDKMTVLDNEMKKMMPDA